MKENQKKIGNRFVTSFITAVALLILSGYALSVLWGWFFVPIFNVPPINIPQALGIALVFDFLSHGNKLPKEESNKDRIENVLYAVSGRIFILIVGYFITLLM